MLYGTHKEAPKDVGDGKQIASHEEEERVQVDAVHGLHCIILSIEA